MRHTFNIICTEDGVGRSLKHKGTKLVEDVEGQTGKTIVFCGPRIGVYSILKQGEKEFLNYVLMEQDVIFAKMISVIAARIERSITRKRFRSRQLN